MWRFVRDTSPYLAIEQTMIQLMSAIRPGFVLFLFDTFQSSDSGWRGCVVLAQGVIKTVRMPFPDLPGWANLPT